MSIKKSSQTIVLAMALLPAFFSHAFVAPTGDEAPNLSWERPEEDIQFRRSNTPTVTVRITGEDSPGFQVTWFYVDGLVAAIIREENNNRSAISTKYLEPGSCKPLGSIVTEFGHFSLPLETDNALYFPSQVHQIWVTGLGDEIYVKVTTPSPSADDYAYWGRKQPRLHRLTEWLARMKATLVERCLRANS